MDEVIRLRAQVEALTARVEALENRVRPAVGWRSRLAWLLGGRLGSLRHYAPRPLRLPARYHAEKAPADGPTVSVVTPSFRQAAFLERTMRSVLDQGYPRLEYIVQDGGSDDGSLAIIERHLASLRHAESAADGGQADAINRGFRHATGEVMAYLNSDDLLLPGAVAHVAAFFAAHPEVDVVYGHRVIIDGVGDEVGRWVLPPHCPRMLRWADYVPQETLFWRRGIWERVGGRIDESFQFAMDWDLLLRFAEAGAVMVRLPRFLGAFRVHDAQKTNATLTAVGLPEMARLRRRTHGRDVTADEVRAGITPYVLRQAVYHRLYSLGLLRV